MATTTLSHPLHEVLPSRPVIHILLLLSLIAVFNASIYTVYNSTALEDLSKGPAKSARSFLNKDSLPSSMRTEGLPKDYATGPIRNIKRRETTCQFCQSLKMAVEGKMYSANAREGGQVMYGGNAQELWSRYCDGHEVKGCSEEHEGILAQSRL